MKILYFLWYPTNLPTKCLWESIEITLLWILRHALPFLQNAGECPSGTSSPLPSFPPGGDSSPRGIYQIPGAVTSQHCVAPLNPVSRRLSSPLPLWGLPLRLGPLSCLWSALWSDIFLCAQLTASRAPWPPTLSADCIHDVCLLYGEMLTCGRWDGY